LTVRIKEGKVKKLTCPDPDCRNHLSYNEIKELIPAPDFKRYKNLIYKRLYLIFQIYGGVHEGAAAMRC